MMTRTTFALGLILATAAAYAQPPQNSSGQNQHQKRKPPKEAMEACNSKVVDDVCSFTTPHGDQLSGNCFRPESDAPLACRPENHPKPQGNVNQGYNR